MTQTTPRRLDAQDTRVPYGPVMDIPVGGSRLADTLETKTQARDNPDARILSTAASREIARRVFGMTTGGGVTRVTLHSIWTGNTRWGRNVVMAGGDTQNTVVGVHRSIRGADSWMEFTNATHGPLLQTVVRRAEHSLLLYPESPDQYPDRPSIVNTHAKPAIWFDATTNIDAMRRATVVKPVLDTAEQSNVLSAGYLEVSASGAAVLIDDQVERYYPYTTAQFSLTVRDPRTNGSGWAGIDFNDWGRIDTNAIAAIAFDKCQRSANPVAIEPGRYTAILEPQAVCDLFTPIIEQVLDRIQAEMGMGPFAAGPGMSKISQQVLDERITISADPMDPDCGFVPFDWNGEPYVKVNWIEQGILKDLAYPRYYGLRNLTLDQSLPNSLAFRMSGGTTSVDDMIESTSRGILITRLSGIHTIDMRTMLLGGTTRDGLWLIERGKITKAIKNFRITESPLFALNNIEQLGIPQRVFRPRAPAVCPALKVRDFSCTGLVDAI